MAAAVDMSIAGSLQGIDESLSRLRERRERIQGLLDRTSPGSSDSGGWAADPDGSARLAATAPAARQHRARVAGTESTGSRSDEAEQRAAAELREAIERLRSLEFGARRPGSPGRPGAARATAGLSSDDDAPARGPSPRRRRLRLRATARLGTGLDPSSGRSLPLAVAASPRSVSPPQLPRAHQHVSRTDVATALRGRVVRDVTRLAARATAAAQTSSRDAARALAAVYASSDPRGRRRARPREVTLRPLQEPVRPARPMTREDAALIASELIKLATPAQQRPRRSATPGHGAGAIPGGPPRRRHPPAAPSPSRAAVARARSARGRVASPGLRGGRVRRRRPARRPAHPGADDAASLLGAVDRAWEAVTAAEACLEDLGARAEAADADRRRLRSVMECLAGSRGGP